MWRTLPGLVACAMLVFPGADRASAQDEKARSAGGAEPAPAADGSETPAKPQRKPRPGSGANVPLEAGPDRRQSERAVCQAQCNLERSSCDSRGAGSFRDRADQLEAARSSCFLAVQSCLARCR